MYKCSKCKYRMNHPSDLGICKDYACPILGRTHDPFTGYEWNELHQTLSGREAFEVIFKHKNLFEKMQTVPASICIDWYEKHKDDWDAYRVRFTDTTMMDVEVCIDANGNSFYMLAGSMFACKKGKRY